MPDRAWDQPFDVAVVGSGFGGAAVACRLAQAGKSIAVLEQGKEYPSGRGEPAAEGHGTDTIRHGHFQVDLGLGMSVIRGRGVGGGSLHYFGVRLRAHPEIFEDPRWPAAITRKTLDPYYDLAGGMIPAAPVEAHPVLGLPVKGEAFLAAARHCRRCRAEPQYVPIAVNTGRDPISTPAGIPQNRCVYCGECLIGCPPSESFDGNVNARALLTLNYLAVARQTGRAHVFPDHHVSVIRQADGGFELDTAVGEGIFHQKGTVRARQVVLAAGTLGTTEILLKSREAGALPGMSAALGYYFSGNGDFLIPKTVNTPRDLEPKSGPSITAGADFSTGKLKIFIEELGVIPFLEAVVGTRKETATTLLRYQLAYLGMGTDAADGVLRLRLGKICVHWNAAASMPLYREITAALREMSQQLGGDYQAPELYNPGTGAGLITAHPLGGCVMSDDARAGVTNPQGEVYGVPGLFVADGSLMPTALATNPSHTISALAERVAFWMIHGREMRENDPDAPPAPPAPPNPLANARRM